MANYSIDGGPPQNRSVPSNSGCNIPQEPFFSMTELPEGNHNITVTVVQVGARPFMFNFFALDPEVTSAGTHTSNAKKSDTTAIAGVAAGILVCILLCTSVVAFRRRSARLKKIDGTTSTSSSDENPNKVDAASICSTCKCNRIGLSIDNPRPHVG